MMYGIDDSSRTQAMQPSGVITITTDFGHKGPFAAVMKGVILQRFRQACIVDLAHDIPAHWPPEAGFWISRSYRFFPPGTVHVAIVDPGVGTGREILIVEYDGHVFMAPDNGLLATMLSTAAEVRVYQLLPQKLLALGITSPSPTFHGRDIFAPIAAEISVGHIQPSQLGKRISEWTPAWIDDPEILADRITGTVITVDAFGNLISNIDHKLLTPMTAPVVCLGSHQFQMKTTYGAVQPGEYLALINSFGVIEVARAEGSAADGLGADRGAPIWVHNS